ncbi:MAG: hypothetical protein IPL71_16450 [Anaerolineales bacterium]|uniref:hypothetical protein n=1 Tax=Candidatus Villigracilis proximus TaxID=3140683 RepID=UPI003137360E|nr:hypothetical protein [Anaerolineales bacterium]
MFTSPTFKILRQLHGFAHFDHGLFGNGTRAFGAVVQNVFNLIGAGGHLGAFGAERLQMFVKAGGKGILQSTQPMPALRHSLLIISTSS